MIYYKNDNLVIRSMKIDDIEKIMSNYIEQGWNKPVQVIEGYYAKQNNNELKVFIAEYKNGIAGYTVLYPNAFYGSFKDKNIPEISDFVVFIKYQRNGIGNAILDQAERIASQVSDRVSLGVGLHSGYGSAQRIYAKEAMYRTAPAYGTIMYNWSLTRAV